MASSGGKNPILQAFEGFRVEFDEHNDRRERLIKSSRDITSLSKKVIFLLHRLLTANVSESETTSENGFGLIAKQGRDKLSEIQVVFRGLKEELKGDMFWRYQSQVSPGLQEYIEALSFTHFLEKGTLITFQEVFETLSDDDGPFFPLPVEEYLLGVSDLTGELMRYAITAITHKSGRQKAIEVCNFVRNCYADFEAFTPYVRFLSKKQSVTESSMIKIEEAAYRLAVRTSEYRDYGVDEGMVDTYITGVIAEGHKDVLRSRFLDDNDADDND